MIVYISGSITKNPNYKRDFKRGEVKMRNAHFTPVNPVKVMPVGLKSHDDYMRISLAWVEACDAIFLLSGWTTSEGAVKEYQHAKWKGKAILFEDGAEEGADL